MSNENQEGGKDKVESGVHNGQLTDPKFDAKARGELIKAKAKIYEESRKELLATQLSNSEIYDKAILSLSMAGLGFSIVIIRYIVFVENVVDFTVLYLSWIFFGLAIVSTIVSFMVSQIAVTMELEYTKKCCLDLKEEYCNKINRYAQIGVYNNFASGCFFIVAIMFTIFFAYQNVNGGSKMSVEENNQTFNFNEGAPVNSSRPAATILKKGAPVNSNRPTSPNTGGGSQGGSTSGASTSGSEKKK